ncbi:MAG: hypothetical protein ACJAVT_001161 [Yoonia sp.]|jgi:hypothetical protein
MSIISTWEAVPSRLFAIYSTLFDSENGEKKDRIEAWATPPSLRRRGAEDTSESTTELFSKSLSEALRIGLVEEIDDRLKLTTAARGAGKKGQDSEDYFLAYMRRTLFDPARSAETKQAGFMIALSWFLSSNPLRPMNFSKEPNNELRAQIGENASQMEISVHASWQNFLYWARYLGFATIVGGVTDAEDTNSRMVIPDPIKAIESALPSIFVDANELSIEQFLLRLSAIFPVFESGTVRNEFEGMRQTPISDRDDRLSITTSLALQRLVDRQRLIITQDSDAKPRILDFGVRKSRVSRVALRVAA